MMKRYDRQKGSALHIVVVGVLILALSASLGVIFYQNFIDKKAGAPQEMVQKETPAGETTKTAQLAFNSDIYAFDHPETWTAATKKVTDLPGGTTGTFTNKDETVRVNIAISGFREDVACNNNDGLKVSYYNVNKTAVKKLTDTPLFLVESMTDKAGGGYTYQIGLTQDGGATHGAVGQARCIVVPAVGNASNAVVDSKSGTLTKPAITATIDFPKLSKEKDGSVKEMQPVKDMLTSPDYKLAAKILESARKQ
jgi:hypothetical protein